MRLVTPLRFVSGVIGLWVAARIVVLMPFPAGDEAQADSPPTASGAVIATIVPPGVGGVATKPADPPRDAPATPKQAPGKPTITAANAIVSGGPAPAAAAGTAAPGAAASTLISPTGIIAQSVDDASRSRPAAPTDGSSRWSGSFYAYRRGDGDQGLATGGQLGGSQAGARIVYRLNGSGPTRLAAAARLSSPLDDRRGAEAAAGIDWHPLPGTPVRLSVERRFDLGGQARNAWSAYAAGGFWRSIGRGIVIDGYGQAGVVGARRGDLFADGALRGGHRSEIGNGRSLTIGGGIWGAAQPRVERIDVGPRVAVGIPLIGTSVTAAAEWRLRVAGGASPRSGLALTLSSDF